MGTALKNCTHSQTSSEIAIASSLLIDFKCVLQNAMSEALSSSINFIRTHGLHPHEVFEQNYVLTNNKPLYKGQNGWPQSVGTPPELFIPYVSIVTCPYMEMLHGNIQFRRCTFNPIFNGV